MKNRLLRAMTGLVIGFATGLAYALVSEHINPLLYAQFHIYYQASEAITAMLRAGLIVALLGLLACLPDSSSRGMLLAAVASTIGMVAAGLQGATPEAIATTALLTAYTFLPMVILFLPLSALLRWSANLIQNQEQPIQPAWKKFRGVMALLGLALLVGSFSAYPRDAQTMLKRMQDVIEKTQSGDKANLPYFFENIADTVENASPNYSLAWSDDIRFFPLGTGSESLAAINVGMSAVTARFESGETVACLFRSDGAFQLCARIE
jgi:hypothetical protein